MIGPEHDLPIKLQAEAPCIGRSAVYYKRGPISAEDLWLMRRIDELHLNYPFASSRMLRDLLPTRLGGWPQTHTNADEEDVYRGHLSQTQHLQASRQ